MPAVTRRAKGTWEGSLLDGSGTVELLSSGISTYAVSWGPRAGSSQATTSPEELIAAAQATCYNMALAQELSIGGTPPANIQTTVEVGFDPDLGITAIVLKVRAAVPGLTADEFQTVSSRAKDSCPVARALSAVPLTLNATLVPEAQPK